MQRPGAAGRVVCDGPWLWCLIAQPDFAAWSVFHGDGGLKHPILRLGGQTALRAGPFSGRPVREDSAEFADAVKRGL